MEIVPLSRVIPIQGLLLFPPAPFRKGSRVLGKQLCSAPLGGAASCLPAPFPDARSSSGQRPEAEVGFPLAVPLSAVPPALVPPSRPQQQNAPPAAPGRDLLIKARLFNPSVRGPDLPSGT